MKRYGLFLKPLLLTGLLGPTMAAQALTEDQLTERISALDWRGGPGSEAMLASFSTIDYSEDEALLLGEDAHEFMFLCEGHDLFKPDVCVVRVSGPEENSTVLYTYEEVGYLEVDDWEEYIDPEELLETIRKGTREANKARAEGYLDLFVDGWAQEPWLERYNAVVYWAIRGHDSEGDPFINAKALKLGRKGFTEIVWNGPPEQFTNARAVLKNCLDSYHHDKGYRYADFMPGVDKVAAVGIGALTYHMITGKSVSRTGGLLAALALLLKKAWLMIALPFVFLWKKVKAFFGSGPGQGRSRIP